jgi:transcriptional regulator with XRE-family HTH domain
LQLRALSGTVEVMDHSAGSTLSGALGDALTDTVAEGAKRVLAIGEFIREQREQAQVSVRQLARLAGVSNPYLSQVERGLRKPSADILQQIAKGLRISAEQLYVRAGILDVKHGDPELAAAILADPVLTERQKHVLVEIYETFRRENAQQSPPHQSHPEQSQPKG